jgi:FkbM family methyltransferase
MVNYVSNYFIPTSILDIGANVGQFYQESKKIFNDSYFLLIEPNPNCEEHLKKLNVDYYIGAVSDSIKEMPFIMNKTDLTSTGNSFYKEISSFFTDDNIVTYNITTTTLDKLFFKKKNFDLIKIDTQGSELDIVKGGVNLIKNTKGIILEVSVTTNEYNLNAPKSIEIFDFMFNLGFENKIVVGHNFNPDNGELVQQDYLFLNKKFIKYE